MADLSVLISQVEINANLEDSAIQCINGLAAKLDEARGSQVAISGIITEMRKRASALAAAIKANTETPVEPVTTDTQKGDPTT